MYWNISDNDRLIHAIKLAEKPELIKSLLNELFTPKEMKASVMRLKAMCMLNDGMSYSQISKVTKLSSRTIARLAKIYDKQEAIQKILKKFKDKGPSYFD